MDQKQRLFIYDRKEMGILIVLVFMVAIFAFTLGVHLGKKIPLRPIVVGTAETPPIATNQDKIPNRQELTEQAKGSQQAVEESLSQSLHDEVTRTGIKAEVPRQVDLPEQPRSDNAGATTANTVSNTRANTRAKPSGDTTEPDTLPVAAQGETAAEGSLSAIEAARRSNPAGRFTLQVGSHPNLTEARDQTEALEALGLKPFLRAAELKGKGKWYRVYLGGFEDKEAAEQAGGHFKDQHVVDSFIVVKISAG